MPDLSERARNLIHAGLGCPVTCLALGLALVALPPRASAWKTRLATADHDGEQAAARVMLDSIGNVVIVGRTTDHFDDGCVVTIAKLRGDTGVLASFVRPPSGGFP